MGSQSNGQVLLIVKALPNDARGDEPNGFGLSKIRAHQLQQGKKRVPSRFDEGREHVLHGAARLHGLALQVGAHPTGSIAPEQPRQQCVNGSSPALAARRE